MKDKAHQPRNQKESQSSTQKQIQKRKHQTPADELIDKYVII